MQSFVFWRHLPRAIGETPRRINQNGAESLPGEVSQKLLSRIALFPHVGLPTC